MLAITTQRLLPSLLSLALLLGSIFFPPLARAEGSAGTQVFTFDETDRIKELIVETLMERPEILIEMSQLLQQRQAEAQKEDARSAILSNRERLFEDDNAPVLGNPDGDVTVVEFFDYNCPYCKKATGPLKELIGTDGGVRLVYREWPILNEGSVFAAKAALASQAQGKYEEFHWALMDLKRVTRDSTLELAESIGLDIDRLQADMEAPRINKHIEDSMTLARELGFSGTPSFVIGEETAPGLIPLEELRRLVQLQRESAS
ncbi:MAG: DsbA family protein [Gammaproteobacteria bacterium]|jgi:protein-disulfide isomerase